MLDRLPELYRLCLSRTRTATGLLRSLKLNDCPWVNDDVLLRPQTYPILQSVNLSGTQITNDGVRLLLKLSDLRWLDLTGCAGVGTETPTVGAERLYRLHLHGATDPDLERRIVVDFTHVYELTLINGNFENDSFRYLVTNRSLHSLHLVNWTLSRDAVVCIGQLPSLVTLQVSASRKI
ncbi:MAG: hypothetical protein P8K08_05120 [Fuerstiella sp.]|nr:hypothetical protein [Fuerstiella sp.]